MTEAPPHTDIQHGWIDRLPAGWRPYARLARLDRPIGAWLLLWPCWWGVALATPAGTGPDLGLLALFAVGTVVMRGAGCTLNDLVDRDIDARVDRTRVRPLPAGEITPRQAAAFGLVLCAIGAAVLFSFNATTIWLGLASLVPVAVYPFMKRITDWPQAMLGVAFNWGALVGWTAVTGSLGWPMLALYLGGIAWTIGYDTIYAHQDRTDDAIVGVRSTALRFGTRTRGWLAGFYAAALGLWALAVGLAGAGPLAAGALTGIAAHFLWQLARLDIDDPARCLALFKANRHVGVMLFAGIVLDRLLGLV